MRYFVTGGADYIGSHVVDALRYHPDKYVDNDLFSKEEGVTNSSTALNNNRIVQSSGGALVEAPAITASRALVSDTNGIPVASSVTSTELGFVSGVTSAIQTQLNDKEPTITMLPISKGGTNSTTALNKIS